MKSAINSLLFLVVIGFLPSCNPYNKPGTRGTIPTPDPTIFNSGQNAIFTFDEIIPDSLPCDEVYCLTVRSNEVAMNCGNYNFTLLYNKAVEIFNNRISTLRCRSSECNPIQTKIIYQSGICFNNVAAVMIKFEIKCVRTDIPADNGLAFRLGTELTAPFKDSLPVPTPVKDETSIIQLYNDEGAEDCPYTFEFKINVLIPVSSCNAVTDYTSYIQKAENRAHLIWMETQCTSEDGCHKHDLQEVGVKWDCQNNKIWVEYWFKVPCSDQ